MSRRPSGDGGQASLMMLAVVAVLLAGALVLFAFGNALGARAATSAPPSHPCEGWLSQRAPHIHRIGSQTWIRQRSPCHATIEPCPGPISEPS